MKKRKAVTKNGKQKSNGSVNAEQDNDTVFKLRLYVAGQTPKSLVALANLKRICSENMGQQQYEIEVIDLLKNPALAQGDQIVAIPTLVRSLPAPLRKIIGDLSDTERVVVGLDLRKIEERPASKAARA